MYKSVLLSPEIIGTRENLIVVAIPSPKTFEMLLQVIRVLNSYIYYTYINSQKEIFSGSGKP